MKKIILSLATIVVLSSFSNAGANTVIVDVLPIPIEEVDASVFYVGVGAGSLLQKNDFTSEEISAITATLQLGYTYNKYISIEARYTMGFDTSYDAGNILPIPTPYTGDFTNVGIYLKPTYPIGDFSIYTFLGYGSMMLSDLNNGDAVESNFQWGGGVSYSITEHISIFADYVSLYNDTGFDYVATADDINSYNITVGVSYRF